MMFRLLKKSDHGIGVQSIIYYVEKEQGQYQFYMEGRGLCRPVSFCKGSFI